MGSGLVLAGLALFMVVFFTLFPILTNPVGAYDRWFPAETEEPAAAAAAAPTRTDPIAGFTWEAVAVETVDPPVYRARFVSTSQPAGAEITTAQWDFGDGSGERGETAVHDYAGYGAYRVTLTVIDSAGAGDTVTGEVAIPGTGPTSGAVGQIDEYLNTDIAGSIEDAVGDVGAEIRDTLDGAVGSIGASARGAVVVFLFALAALATTIVAWRIGRLGVMILNGPPAAPVPPSPPPYYDEPAGQRQLEAVH